MTLRTRLAAAFFVVAAGPVALAAFSVRGVALAAMAMVAAVLAGTATWWLDRWQRRRLASLAEAANRIAQGDLGVRVPEPATEDEVGRLAGAFNRMTQRTQAYVRALTAGRDQLRRHLAVLGDTLSSTHDLDRILQVILRTALAATTARSGAVLLLDSDGATLTGQLAPEQEAEPVPVTVPLGAGLLGTVAATGEPRRGRVDSDRPPAGAAERSPRSSGRNQDEHGVTLHRDEPSCRTYVVVPISVPGGILAYGTPWPSPPGAAATTAGRAAVRGVLALYDRLGGDEFDDTDLVTLRTFAGQAAVAVDNVRTHEEAQRLSLTDPLTGLWNYRYLRESMRREVERASRFGHRLAVLTLDLDRFKEVNDAHGHPAGDKVLVEFARRITRATREVDLVFRQGGEEFVVLLPETDTRGATVLAQRLGAAVRDEPVRLTHREPFLPGGPDAAGAPSLAIDISVSIGIAVYPDHALTPGGVLDAADEALYAAKAAGRDTHRVAESEPAPVAAAELPVRVAARSPDDGLPHAGSINAAARRGATGGAPAPRQHRSG